MSIKLLVVVLLIYCISNDYITYAGPLVKSKRDNTCSPRCDASCAPSCTGCAPAAAGAIPPPKQQFTIGSVEEGETKECDDKGFNSPTDNSEDPPGTITIPLPPTMYVPPRPGEDPKELPLPDFKIPESVLQGKLPDKSITLTPEEQSSFKDAYTGPSPPVVDAKEPFVTVPAPSPPVLETKEALVTVSEADKIVVSPPPLPPPPPPAPPPVQPPAPSGYSLQFPKLPPVTVSEIPGRANRLPPLPPRPAPKGVSAINLPKPPPIHVAIVGENTLPSGISAVGPSVSTANVETVPAICTTPPCESRSGR